MKLNSLLYFYLLVILNLIGLLYANQCPSGCTCTDKSFNCFRRKFDEIPKFEVQTISYLSLTNGNLREIKTNSFQSLRDLIYLDLSNNKIGNIEENSLDGPIYLQKLILKNNYIVNFPDRLFDKFFLSLTNLVLRNNKIEKIPLSIEKLLNLKQLDISNNPLHCPCELKYFATKLPQLESLYSPATCETPKSTENLLLSKIDFKGKCTKSNEEAFNPPIFINKLKDTKAALGERIIFNCETKDVRNDIIEWILPFEFDKYHSFYLRNHILVIHEVHENYKGFIQCKVYNKLGVETSSANLIIVENQRPYIIEGPSSIVVEKGSSVQFKCRARGYPKPEITWLLVKATSSKRLSTGGKFIVRDNVLIIQNVTEEEKVGKYTCYASSVAGSARVSAVITLIEKLDLSDKPVNIQTNKKLQNDKIIQIIDKAREKINKAFKKTADRLRNPNDQRSRANIQSLFRQPNLAALELARASELYESVLDEIVGLLKENNIHLNLTTTNHNSLDISSILTVEQIAIISQFSGCQRSTDEIYCAQQLCFHKKYRSIDGKCNNLINPRKGSALSPFYRLLPPQYENGINTPIGWSYDKLYFGYPKPSARLVSSRLLRANKVSPDPKHSVMMMQWGQFLDHDLDFTPVDAATSRFSDGLACNETCVNDSPCFPILTPPNDLRIRRPCIGFSRSIATCGSGHSSIVLGQLHYREQVNQITSFIDASNVYASEDLEATELRDLTYDEGKLRVGSITQHNKRLLPFNIRGQIDCQIDPEKSHVPCFKAGDHRNNENLGLLTMHTIWMREHNRIADELRSLNNHWSGDKVFFETRKIVGALMQHFTYSSWLPQVLGSEGMHMLGNYNGYNDSVDSTISNVFATAAMRFGHTLINPILYRLDENFKPIPEGNLPLHKAFFAPDRMMQDGGIDPIIRGLYAKSSKAIKSEEPMNTELIEKLFAMAHEVALDLGALNIQRGRDHGLPPYNDWRKLCGLKIAENFDDFSKEIPSKEIREKMRQVYGHPGNVDLFAGGILEKKSGDGLVGPTFRCILVDQFRRLRDGDRFWYENSDQFSPSQLSQLRQVTLNRIICDNGDNIKRIQKNVFVVPDHENDFLSCNSIKKINFLPWKECVNEDSLNKENEVLESSLSRTRRNAEPLTCTAGVNGLKLKIGELEREIQKLKNI